MIRLYSARPLAILFVVVLIASGYGPCSTQQQPKTVADALTTLGNIKREAKKQGEITAQQDLDISRKLHDANRAYKKFVMDEQARIAAGTPDPSARAAALSELRSLLSGLNDPSVLGFKSDSAKKAWSAAVTSMNTILAAFGG